MVKKLIILLFQSGAILALDQLSKLFVHNSMQLGDSKHLIHHFLSITYVKNTGAAFGIFSNSPEFFKKILFLVITPLAILFVLWILKDIAENKILEISALAAIVGGALGNYVDRLRLSYVIDFFDFQFGHWHFPAFNVADLAIVSGILILMIKILLEPKQEV